MFDIDSVRAIYADIVEQVTTTPLKFSLIITASCFVIPGPLSWVVGKFLRFILIPAFYFLSFVTIVSYAVVRLAIRLMELVVFNPKHKKMRHSAKRTGSYAEWYAINSELDSSQGRDKWRDCLESGYTAKFFDWKLLQDYIADLQFARKSSDMKLALKVLQECTRSNTCGIFYEELYSYTNTGEPKVIVNQFVEELEKTIRWATERKGILGNESETAHPSLQNPSHSFINYLTRAKLIYGRQVLCLSGGGMMGCYHLGIIRALLDEKALPRVVSGSSCGSLIGAFLCTRTDEELERDLVPEVIQPHFTCCARTWPERIKGFFSDGCLFDNDEWFELCKWFTCGDLTFQEAYVKTGRVLCITLSAKTKRSPPILLNHITSPNVIIASAVVASAGMPPLLKPSCLRMKYENGEIQILREKFWDGSIDQDIPISGLSELLNCTYFIVAQVNPHIVLFQFGADGEVGNPNRWKPSRRGGHLLSGLEMFFKMFFIFLNSFLKEVGAITGLFSNIFSQTFYGSTTIAPDVTLVDFLQVITDPTIKDMQRFFTRGRVAAYRNMALIKLKRKIELTLESCLQAMDAHTEADVAPAVERQERPKRNKRKSMVGLISE